MPSMIDLAGQRFHRLEVIGRAPSRGRKTMWTCLCDCGTIKDVHAALLRGGQSRSCGCLQRDIARQQRLHGRSDTPEYHAWYSMRDRCDNSSSQSYSNYGARGITVAERWQSFENFYADMGDRPVGMSLERIDNDGPYSPQNCRWANCIEQHRNTRRTKRLTLRGETRCLQEWAQITGINRRTISQRLSKGLSVEDALTRPIGPTGRRIDVHVERNKAA